MAGAAKARDLTGREVLWAPQPGPQTALLTCPAFEVFFGGARGGGKSDGVLGDWIQHAHAYGEHARGIMVRREAVQLEDIIARSHQLYSRLGWAWNGTTKTWRSAVGATLRFRHLWDEVAAENYQGHAYTRFYPEELTNWPSEKPILRMLATLRSAAGVPVGMRATGNPGGPGHNWVKARYIDSAAPMTPIVDSVTGSVRVFIPSRLTDNPALLSADPTYPDRLRDVGSAELVRAWLGGDWNIVAGGALDDIWTIEGAKRIVVEPFEIPKAWRLFRAFDWGSSKPFSVGWYAVADGTAPAGVPQLPRGSLVRFAELYGWNGKPNEGSRRLAVDVAREILEVEKQLGIAGRVQPGPADSAIYAAENGQCIADDMTRLGVRFVPADKSPGSRKAGLERVRKMLQAATVVPREEPCLVITSTCRHALRTLPTLPRDPRDPDDVDTAAEDHVADEVRYSCMTADRMPAGVY